MKKLTLLFVGLGLLGSSASYGASFSCTGEAYANSAAGGLTTAIRLASSDAENCVIDKCMSAGYSLKKCNQHLSFREVSSSNSYGYVEEAVEAKIRF